MINKLAIRDKLSGHFYTGKSGPDAWVSKVDDARLYNSTSVIKGIIKNQNNWIHTRWTSRHNTTDTEPEMIMVAVEYTIL